MIEPDIVLREEHYSFAKHRDEKVQALVVTFFKNNSPKVLTYMNDIYNRDHIHTFPIDTRTDPIQTQHTIPINKEVEIIHPGFSAGKLENQNEFTNRANNITMFSIYRGAKL